MEEYVTTISLKYCNEWGTWEAIREIYQNSLDATGKVPNVEFNDGNLTISDNGNGLTLKQLCLLGISEKTTNDARGHFGEGLKIGLVIFVRKGHTVELRSKDFKAIVDHVEKFGEKVLRYRYTENLEDFQGLQITVKGFSEDINFKELFNDGTKNTIVKNIHGEIIEENTHRLYVKNIFVKELDNSVFSYDIRNIRLERDRNTPNEYDVQYYVGYLLDSVKSLEQAVKVIEAFKRNTLESNVRHFNGNSYYVKAFKMLYGENATISNDDGISGKARYHGFKNIIFSNERIREAFEYLGIRNTLGAINDKMAKRKEKEVKDLSKLEAKNLKESLLTLARATHLKIPTVKVYVSRDKDLLGYCKRQNGIIGLNRIVLKNRGELITTLTEELVHYNDGCDDITPEFQQSFVRNMSLVIEYMTKRNVDSDVVDFSAKLLKSKLKINGKIYYQYSVKLPSRLNSKLENKTEIKIKVEVEK